MDYDVLVLGGGIIGCAVAYELSKYNLNIAVIEKDFDIADDISFANTAIVYDGVEAKDDLMSRLEHMGNGMLEDITKKFNVPFKRIGSLRIAETEESIKKIEAMYNVAKSRGIENIHLIDDKDIYDIEPNLKSNVKKAIYSTNTAVVRPYDLAIAYGEVAFDNGVSFRLEEIVIDIQRIAKGFKVTTNKNKFTCRVVINTIPGDNYTIDNNKVNIDKQGKTVHYLLVEDKSNDKLTNIVTKVNAGEGFIIQTPTLNGQTLIGVNSKECLNFNGVIKKSSELMPEIDRKNIDNIFYDDYNKEGMIIDDSQIEKGYIKVTGKHYAEVTIAPAISNLICETIVENLNCALDKNFVDKRRDSYRFKSLSKKERNDLISLDDRYGKIVCLCNQVSEGEIVDCIRRPLGARTVEGVKRRTGATFGKCHGSYCISKIINILARETGKKPTEIVEDSKNSKVLVSRIKEFNEV
ncbi:L-2-hydroxyglutarate oxidase LhgO [Clostridium cavendishii DSM 21758]|uniref:L-2-hydroxyglutarate oxidase LhgO n=1 Tax=Clostridium cavendishii DSM 21758 TaxID=1121302 RepID=A0A1M6VPU7_9CLOT|nr:FAD-dependent oxidoreductase [Clostridium cavendishii]SHK83374.1 L-2-hydroxyglutarate oxidase LhgO [Clostridium cavendishii DSM 21758]